MVISLSLPVKQNLPVFLLTLCNVSILACLYPWVIFAFIWDENWSISTSFRIDHYLLQTSQNVSSSEFTLFAGVSARKLAFLVAQTVKNLPVMQETWVQSLGWEDALEKGMVTHSSILAWRIPWSEEPGRLQSMWLQRVGHDWVANAFTFIFSLKTWILNLSGRSYPIQLSSPVA